MRFFYLFALVMLPALAFTQTLNHTGNVTFCENGNLIVTDAPGGTSFQWQQGGTDIPGANAATYNVTATGSYRVILQNGGNRDTLGPVQVTIRPNPVASFSFTPSNICMNDPVRFTYTGGSSGVSYEWDFDDPNSGGSNTSTSANPTHRFVGTPGNNTQNFNVRLTVTNSFGCTRTVTRTVTMNQMPGTELNGSGRTNYNGQVYFTQCTQTSFNFNFVNNSSTQSTNTNYQIVWGNGSPDFVSSTFNTSISQTYTVGLYTLLFIVTGNNGCKDTATYRVFVGSNPAIGFGTPGSSTICNDETLTFQISNYSGNPPSTQYTVLFNDGTPPINFNHPPPADVSHVFDTTSCGTTSGAFANSFSATIEATNACSRSVVQVVPIYVSEKPDPEFTISPNDTMCVNQVMTLTNVGNAASYNNNGTCEPGKFVWKITPSTGFTVVSGSTGNDFGSTDPDLWNSGSTEVQLNFNSAGVYTIELLAGNTKCGNASVTKTVCITAEPSGTFTLNETMGCAPFTVSTTLNTNTVSCGNMQYNWEVSYVPTNGCSPSTADFDFIGGTSATSVQPQIRFNNPGTYTIRPTLIAPSGACSTQLAPQQVVVRAKPVVQLGSLPASLCVDQSVSPLATANCYIDAATTYNWTFNGGTPATATTLNPGSVTFGNDGTRLIELAVTNACGTTTVSTNVVVNPTPLIDALSDVSLCSGASSGAIAIGTTPNTGVAVSWTNSLPSIGLASSGTNSIPAFTAVNNGTSSVTATVQVNATLGTCTSNSSFSITVAPAPSAPTATNVQYCIGETATALTATASANHTLQWYSTATGGTPAATAPVPATTTAGTTTYYVSQANNTSNCESVRTPITVTIHTSPVIGSVTGVNPTLCSAGNGSIQITGLTPNTSYLVQYTAPSGAQSTTLTSNATGVITITGLSAGSYSNITVTANNCTSAPAGPVSLSDPSAPAAPTANNNGPVCSGSTLQLSANAITGATYTWTGPNGFTANTQNPSIPNVDMAANGTYSVTVTVSGCTSPAATTDVVVHETPVINQVLSNSPVCSGSDIQLSAQVQYTGTVSYTWTGPNGFTATTASPVITNAQPNQSGTYQLQVTDDTGGCLSTTETVQVTVNPTPVITNITSVHPTLCSTPTGSISIHGLTPGVLYNITYTKNGGNQNTAITADAGGVVEITGLTAGTYSDFNVSTNGCFDNDASVVVLSDPNPPATPTPSSNAPLCSGNNLTLSTPVVPGSATYNWTGPNGFSSISQNPVIAAADVSASGTYSVTVTVSGCTSAAGTTDVIIHETPATPTLTTNAPICNGNTLELNSTTTFTGALSYTWTGPGGFTAGTANTSIPNAQTINSGTYSLQITSVIGSCNATPATIPATVFETPVITSTAFTHPTQCNTPTGSITIFGMQANTTYTVSYEYNTAPQSIMLTSNNTGSILISNLPAGVYSLITVSVNGCTSAPAPSVALMDPNPPAPPTLSYNGPVCTNETIQLNAATSQPGTATFNWNGPAGFIGTQSAHQIINATDLNAGTYYATVTIDNCTSNPAQLLVVVHPLPDAPVAASPVQYCINTTATALTATPATGNTLNWYLSTNRQNPVATAPVPNTATIGSTTFYVTQTNTHVCEGPETPVVVQINPDAEAVFNPTATEGCPPFDIDHSIIGLQQFPDNNDAYNWYANNVFIGTGTTFPGYTIAQQNDSITIKLVTTSPFGCLSDSTEHKFFTYKVPQPAFAADVYEGCGPLSVNFSNNTPDQNLYTYHWDFDNGITSTLAQPGNVVFQPNPLSGDTVYNVRLQVTSFCEVITVTHPITVKSKPIALFSPSRTVGCSPMQVTFVNTTRGNNITYHWDFGDGQVFNTTNNSNVQHTYYTGVADTFTVRLIATNECGADTTQFELIAAPNNINLNFQMNGPDQFGCAPHTVPFINNTPGASVFNWDFGDGNVLSTTASSDTVYHTYVSPGTYTITLHAENACTDTSATRTITVFPKPAASFNADRYTVCIGESVQLNNTSDAANSYLWNFGDGHTSTLVHPTHSYTAAGSYTVQLIIYRLNAPGNVCTDTTEQTIQVVSGLPGSFTVDRNGSCVPMTVTFVNEQAPSQLSTWDFGDGQSASGDSVVHTYMNPGNYTVQLTAMSPGGCNYSSTQTIQVTGVSGTLNYSGGYVCHPNSVRLEVSGTNIHEIEWNFGDGQTVTNNQQVMHHVYANPGNYLPSATLYSSNGCTFFLQGNDTIKVDKLDAGFAYTQHRYCGYTTINFEDTSSVFFGIQQIEWNFGDGNTATGSMVSHNYTASGNYQVTMVITGNSGCTETVVHTVPVTVNQIPSASIHAVSEGCTGETIRFQSVLQSIDAVTITQWNISNGVTGTGDRFEYVFTQAGNYTVRLIAGTDAGCFDTAVHIIEIRPAPHVTASGDVTYCLGSDAQLNVTGAITYQWTPGNALSCTDCANPVTSTTTTTPYVVTGTAANGCTSTDTVVVTVIHPLNMDVSANDSICIGMSAQLNASGAASYIWTPSNTLNNNRIPNPVATPTTTTTYRVIGYDGHNCFTDTAFVVVGVGQYPTVDLGPDLNLSAGTNHPLTSVVTNGPIAIWEWSPPNDLDCADCPQPIAYIRDNVTYTVRVVTPYGCDATDDVHIKVFCTDGQVYIPNAFTPDGDGINDILMVRGTGIARVKTFRIFNRWGEVVFERSNFQPNNPAYGWDGKVRGKVAGPDVFVYTAEVICENGTPYTYKGNVSIIK